jgi:hypothetical protein
VWMSKPFALALLIAIGASSSGCGERRTEEPPKAAERDCPTERSEPDKGSICLVKRGPNWKYVFAYPAEAARIPALDAWLRSQFEAEDETNQNDADGLGALARYAKEYAKENPEGRLFREEVYTLDADLPGLLALSKDTGEYSGGAHGWFVYDTLFWDKSRNRELEPKELFSDPAAANTEIRDQLCPILAEARRNAAEDGVFNGRCQEPPYDTMALLAAGGRVTTLKITFTELEGYAGGTYQVYVPVTRRLLDLMAERFRAAFALSASPPRACKNELGCVEGRPPQSQPQ